MTGHDATARRHSPTSYSRAWTKQPISPIGPSRRWERMPRRAYMPGRTGFWGETAARAKPVDLDAVRSSYTTALEMARERGMRPLETHCLDGLAQLAEQRLPGKLQMHSVNG